MSAIGLGSGAAWTIAVVEVVAAGVLAAYWDRLPAWPRWTAAVGVVVAVLITAGRF